MDATVAIATRCWPNWRISTTTRTVSASTSSRSTTRSCQSSTTSNTSRRSLTSASKNPSSTKVNYKHKPPAALNTRHSTHTSFIDDNRIEMYPAGDLLDEDQVLEFLTSLEAMELPDQIEEVNAKIFDKIVQDADFVAVCFCNCSIQSIPNKYYNHFFLTLSLCFLFLFCNILFSFFFFFYFIVIFILFCFVWVLFDFLAHVSIGLSF